MSRTEFLNSRLRARLSLPPFPQPHPTLALTRLSLTRLLICFPAHSPRLPPSLAAIASLCSSPSPSLPLIFPGVVSGLEGERTTASRLRVRLSPLPPLVPCHPSLDSPSRLPDFPRRSLQPHLPRRQLCPASLSPPTLSLVPCHVVPDGKALSLTNASLSLSLTSPPPVPPTPVRPYCRRASSLSLSLTSPPPVPPTPVRPYCRRASDPRPPSLTATTPLGLTAAPVVAQTPLRLSPVLQR